MMATEHKRKIWSGVFLAAVGKSWKSSPWMTAYQLAQLKDFHGAKWLLRVSIQLNS